MDPRATRNVFSHALPFKSRLPIGNAGLAQSVRAVVGRTTLRSALAAATFDVRGRLPLLPPEHWCDSTCLPEHIARFRLLSCWMLVIPGNLMGPLLDRGSV